MAVKKISLIKSGTILFIASITGNVSNYLFQFFMGRYLSIEDYGAMNAVFSIMIIVGLPTTAIMLVIAKYIATFKAKGEEAKVSSLYQNSLIKMAVLGVVCVAPFFVFNSLIAGYLKIDSGWPAIIIGIGLFFSFVIAVNLGMLQGLKRFYCLGAGMGLGGPIRLIFGALLVFLGLGLNGALASTIFSGLLIFVITTIPLSAYFKKREAVEKDTKDILLYSIPVLLSCLIFATMTNIDLIMVKHFFTPEQAGLYAAVTILAKTILYLPSAFVLAMFPIVSESHALNHNVFKVLDKGLFYTVVISVAGLLIFYLFPEPTIRTLFGDRFVSVAPLLKIYGLAMMFMTVITVLISFNLARHRTGFIYSLGAGCVLLIILLNLFHSSLLTVIFAMIGVYFCLMVVNLWMVYRDRRAFYRVMAVEENCGGSRSG
ncbi:MAG: oligosaccharide flippase family protein [Thermodesulfobacteriota bacterium]